MPAGELIGRERELASLTEMLSDRATRLVTVTGPAGVGKTRLATAAAQAIAPDLPGGGDNARAEFIEQGLEFRP